MSKQRKQYLRLLKDFLQKQSYVLLKFTHNDLSEVSESEDIDLFALPSFTDKMDVFLQEQNTLTEIEKEVKSYGTHFHLYFQDGGFLQIDVLHSLERKGLVYLPANRLWKNRTEKNGLWVCNTKILLEHVFLFNLLNEAAVPQKYIDYLATQPEADQQEALSNLNTTFQLTIENTTSLTTFTPARKQQVKQLLQQQRFNRFPFLHKRYGRYLLDTVRTLFKTRGRIITFSGVDGAGKSTLLNDVQQRLQQQYRRKVVVLRHRPSILPIISAWRYGKKAAEARSVSQLPRQGKNAGLLSSLLRFAYYYTDYFIGQAYVYFRYVLRGYVVLYDRYYFDFIADPRRSNLQLPEAITKPLYRLLNKPQLNIFLYADADTILARKQELQRDDIEALTNRYLKLFNEFQGQVRGTYLPLANYEREESLNIILLHYAKIA